MGKREKVSQYRNLQQLLDAHGAENPYHFGRNLYKYTGCGPWTVFILSKESARDEVENIVLACDPITHKAKVESGNPSPDTLQTLCLDDPTRTCAEWTWEVYCEKLDKFIAEHGKEIQRAYRPNSRMELVKKSIARRWIRVSRHVPETTKDFYYEDFGRDKDGKPHTFDYSRCIGIKVGSIVEGSDVEIGPRELLFPFSGKDLDAAIQGIDDEASFYWDRDNSY